MLRTGGRTRCERWPVHTIWLLGICIHFSRFGGTETDLTNTISSTSVVLQKSRHFSYTPYISRCCEHVAVLNATPTDKYLPYIIHLQFLTEKIEDAVNRASATGDYRHFMLERQDVTQKCIEIKSSMPFSLSESRKMPQMSHFTFYLDYADNNTMQLL